MPAVPEAVAALTCCWAAVATRGQLGGAGLTPDAVRAHLDLRHREADMRRERAIVLSGRRVLRATSFELRVEPALIAPDLRTAGVATCQKLAVLQPHQVLTTR